jgi:hypothetical protein
LDFQNDVRPAQLKKLGVHKDGIAEVAQKMEINNRENLEQIDIAYKETADLEA